MDIGLGLDNLRHRDPGELISGTPGAHEIHVVVGQRLAVDPVQELIHGGSYVVDAHCCDVGAAAFPVVAAAFDDQDVGAVKVLAAVIEPGPVTAFGAGTDVARPCRSSPSSSLYEAVIESPMIMRRGPAEVTSDAVALPPARGPPKTASRQPTVNAMRIERLAAAQ